MPIPLSVKVPPKKSNDWNRAYKYETASDGQQSEDEAGLLRRRLATRLGDLLDSATLTSFLVRHPAGVQPLGAENPGYVRCG
jgi:hypothetical protein